MFKDVLVAQAQALNIPIISADRAFDSYGVRRIWQVAMLSRRSALIHKRESCDQLGQLQRFTNFDVDAAQHDLHVL